MPKSSQIQFFYNACTLLHHIKLVGKFVKMNIFCNFKTNLCTLIDLKVANVSLSNRLYKCLNRLPRASMDEITAWIYHDWIWLPKSLLCSDISLFKLFHIYCQYKRYSFLKGDLSHSVLSIVRTY